ncbi:hypothetical protein M8J76_007266 [Diaphorina citri]|nr:hypothetical protein M8J76_007266 [Diaphorina citri]
MFVISQSGEYVCIVIQDVTDWEIHQDVVNARMPITLDTSRSWKGEAKGDNLEEDDEMIGLDNVIRAELGRLESVSRLLSASVRQDCDRDDEKEKEGGGAWKEGEGKCK